MPVWLGQLRGACFSRLEVLRIFLAYLRVHMSTLCFHSLFIIITRRTVMLVVLFRLELLRSCAVEPSGKLFLFLKDLQVRFAFCD